MKITPDQTIAQRVAVIEEALVSALNRDGCLSVEWVDGEPYVFVPVPYDKEARTSYSIHEIARDMERRLS